MSGVAASASAACAGAAAPPHPPAPAGCAAATATAAGSCAADPAAGPPRRPTVPKVASSAPVRLHVLHRDAAGAVPGCDCGRQHATFGDTYRYCACGLSGTQPWCDRACAGDPRAAAFPPADFVVDKRQTFLLMCACKRTSDPRGFCDGGHIHIDWARAALEW